MHNVEIELRFLADQLEPNVIALLTDGKAPHAEVHYANFTLDDEVKLRAQKSPLRVRLYQAVPADVVRILAEAIPLNRLHILRAIAQETERELEFTLKVPTEKGHGRGELESLAAISTHLGIGEFTDSIEKFDEALRGDRLAICASVYTQRFQWDLGPLTDHSSLIVTRDSSWCHHQLDSRPREIIEVEALVSMKGNHQQTQLAAAAEEAETALRNWVKSKLGFIPPSVIGTAGACIIAHNLNWAKEMFAKGAVKRSTLDQMVKNGELADSQRQLILAK